MVTSFCNIGGGKDGVEREEYGWVRGVAREVFL
jgi:hypothetical protein